MAWATQGTAPSRTLRDAVEVFSEETENVTDKSFDVTLNGAAAYYEVVGIRIEYVATSEAGTRTFAVQVKDSAGDIILGYQLSSNANVTASNTLNVELSPNSENVAAVGGTAREFLPEGLYIRAGDALRIFESAAIDPVGDEMLLHLTLRGVSLSLVNVEIIDSGEFAVRLIDSATETTYTAVLADDVVLCDCTTANVVITLPTAASAKGKVFYFKKLDASAKTLTIDGDGAETIDDSATAVLVVQYEAITISSDGTEWWIT